MKLFVVLLAISASTLAVPSALKIGSKAAELAAVRALPALDHEEVHDKYGQYALRYVTAEGIVVSERGRLVLNIEGDGYVLITEGEIAYISDDGKVYVTKFSAGLDGTHMEGNHIPVAPVQIVPDVPEVVEIPKSDPVANVVPVVPRRFILE